MPTGQGLCVLFELVGAEQLSPQWLFVTDFKLPIRRANPKLRDPPLQDAMPISQKLRLLCAARYRRVRSLVCGRCKPLFYQALSRRITAPTHGRRVGAKHCSMPSRSITRTRRSSNRLRPIAKIACKLIFSIQWHGPCFAQPRVPASFHRKVRYRWDLVLRCVYGLNRFEPSAERR